LKKYLSPSTVISCIALFVALSGAAYAATLGKNAVKTKNIANGAVTAKKLKNASVTAAKIANGAVIGSKIANGAVGASKIADGSVRSSALGGGVVTTGKLKDLNVTEGKLAGNAVTAAKISAGAVETGKLGKEAVTGEKLSASLLGQLVKNVAYVTAQTVANAEDKPKAITATCPTGKEAIGGGARVTGAEVSTVAVTESFVTSLTVDGKRTGWTGVAMEMAPEAKAWGVEAVAICAEL
jgi:hypothetical protein